MQTNEKITLLGSNHIDVEKKNNLHERRKKKKKKTTEEIVPHFLTIREFFYKGGTVPLDFHNGMGGQIPLTPPLPLFTGLCLVATIIFDPLIL